MKVRKRKRTRRRKKTIGLKGFYTPRDGSKKKEKDKIIEHLFLTSGEVNGGGGRETS